MNKIKRKAYRFSANTRSEKELSYLELLEDHLATSQYSQTERLMNFALYTPRQNLTTFLCKYEIFKRILNIQGSIVECGVLFGGGLMAFAQLSAIFEPTNHQRKIIGFDTFAGHSRLTRQDKDSRSDEARKGGFRIDSYKEIQGATQLYDINRFVGHIPKVELIKGDAEKTIPRYVKQAPHLVVSLLYLDFDVYAPTKAALDHFLPRMPKGAVIAFDELNLRDWPGETVAVLEKLNLRQLKIERFTFGSTISFGVIE